jgi:hypothetical protein
MGVGLALCSAFTGLPACRLRSPQGSMSVCGLGVAAASGGQGPLAEVPRRGCRPGVGRRRRGWGMDAYRGRCVPWDLRPGLRTRGSCGGWGPQKLPSLSKTKVQSGITAREPDRVSVAGGGVGLLRVAGRPRVRDRPVKARQVRRVAPDRGPVARSMSPVSLCWRLAAKLLRATQQGPQSLPRQTLQHAPQQECRQMGGAMERTSSSVFGWWFSVMRSSSARGMRALEVAPCRSCPCLRAPQR